MLSFNLVNGMPEHARPKPNSSSAPTGILAVKAASCIELTYKNDFCDRRYARVIKGEKHIKARHQDRGITWQYRRQILSRLAKLQINESLIRVL